MRGLQALWGHLAQLPAIFSRIDRRSLPSAETRGQLQRPPAHFLPPGVPFWTKGTFPFHSLHPPLPFYEQVKDMEPAQLHPVISFSLLPGHPHGARDERSVPFGYLTITRLFDVEICFWCNYALRVHISLHGSDLVIFAWVTFSFSWTDWTNLHLIFINIA